MTFGEKLKKLREEHKWTQHDLSTKIEISQPTIHSYERDSKMPRPETIVKISKVFDVTTDFLLGIEGEKLSKNERLDQISRANPPLSDKDKLEFVKSLSRDEAESLVLEIKKRFPD